MIGALKAWRERLLRQTYLPPFPQPLPSNVDRFVAVEPAGKILRRRLRRGVWLALNRQPQLERQRIAPDDQRILWIHRGHPQVGDSLMDMACRVLLRGRPGRIDLLTDAHLVELYQEDDVLHRVYGDAREAAGQSYDLVLLLSASAQSLRDKLRFFRQLPYVNLHGFYTGPEFHRLLFGFYRLDQLLGGCCEPAAIEPVARTHMAVGGAVRQRVDALGLPAKFIAIAVGGVHGWRTYDHWPAVLDELTQRGLDLPVVLLGAANGEAMRDALLRRARGAGAVRLIDAVNRHRLPEVFEILRRSALAICCDGGLLHVAHAAQTTTVSLFAERIQPEYRLTCANRSLALYSAREVSAIPPALVAASAMHALRNGVDGVSVQRL